MYIEALSGHFSDIIDQRQTAKVTYPLEDILFVTLCAFIASAEPDSFTQMLVTN
jgi:hypothetical protein